MKVRIYATVVACAALVAALVVGNASAATVKSYCIDGATVSVSNATLADAQHQFQLDLFAQLGQVYTAEGLSFGTDADAAAEPESLLDSLGDLDDVTSAFPIPGGVLHTVAAGACAGTATGGGGAPAPPDGGAPAAVLPPPDPGVFLCYSKFQVDPGVWPTSEARTLVADGGYWKPSAVPGIESSTTLGNYSLVCNPNVTTAASGNSTASSQTPSGVDGDGQVVTDPALLADLDVYPLAQ